MTTSFAEDEEYLRSRDLENMQGLIRAAWKAGLLSDAVYHALLDLAESGEHDPQPIGTTLAAMVKQAPVGTSKHTIGFMHRVYRYQKGRVRT